MESLKTEYTFFESVRTAKPALVKPATIDPVNWLHSLPKTNSLRFGIRRALLGERDELEKIVRTKFEIWKDNVFAATWRRWQNWRDDKPFVAFGFLHPDVTFSQEDSNILGFNAVTYSRPWQKKHPAGHAGYVNIYYIGVVPEWRGYGIGWRLLDVAIEEAAHRHISRIKWKCLKDNKPGLDFWYALGAHPCAESDRELIFDHPLAIEDHRATTAEELRVLWMQPDEIPLRSLGYYARYAEILPHAKPKGALR